MSLFKKWKETGPCGRMYTSARNTLGMARAKEIVASCTNSRKNNGHDSVVSLGILDDEIQGVMRMRRGPLGIV